MPVIPRPVATRNRAKYRARSLSDRKIFFKNAPRLRQCSHGTWKSASLYIGQGSFPPSHGTAMIHRVAVSALSWWPEAPSVFFLLLFFDPWCERYLRCCLSLLAPLAVPPVLELRAPNVRPSFLYFDIREKAHAAVL